MSLLHYFLFHLAIVALISQGAFADGSKCSCWCPKSKSQVCDIIDALQTAEDVSRMEREKWNKYFQFVVKLHRDSEEDLKQGEGSVKMSMSTLAAEKQNAELLAKVLAVEEKFLAAEGRAVKLEADLEKERNTRIGFEKKMAEFERKLQSVLYQFERSETHLKKETDARKEVIEEDMLRNFSTMMSTVEKQNLELQTTISFVAEKLYQAENLAKKLESEIGEEREARKLFEEEISQDFSSAISTYENKSKELQIDMSNIKVRLKFVENQVDSSESAIKEEKTARKELEEDVEAIRKKCEACSKDGYNQRRIRALENPSSDLLKEFDIEENNTVLMETVTTEEPHITENGQMLVNLSTETPGIDEEISDFVVNTLFKLQERFITAEYLIRTLDLNLKLERNARETFELDILQNFTSATSLMNNRSLQLMDTISEVQGNLNFTNRRTTILELGLRYIINKLDVFKR